MFRPPFPMPRFLPLAFALALSGCASWLPGVQDQEAPPEPPPADPVEAFEKVGDPPRDDAHAADDPDNLSSDIQRLQDARRAYEAAESFRAAETRRRQEKCRESGEGREVPIEDGSGSTYCEDAPADAPEAQDADEPASDAGQTE